MLMLIRVVQEHVHNRSGYEQLGNEGFIHRTVHHSKNYFVRKTERNTPRIERTRCNAKVLAFKSVLSNLMSSFQGDSLFDKDEIVVYIFLLNQRLSRMRMLYRT